MNCEIAHERIVTAVYGELPDDEVHELERHLSDCGGCRSEREQIQALQILAAALPVTEPDPNLIARARMRLDEALDAMPPRRWYERWGQRLRNAFAGLAAAPVAALLVTAIGFGAGGYGGYRYARHSSTAVPAPHAVSATMQPAAAPHRAAAEQPLPEIAEVASVSSVSRRPHSEQVEITYNQIVPRRVTGSLDNPGIRQLLMMAVANQASAQVRGASVSLLAAECRLGHSCQPSGIRDALIVALRYDDNPEVREKALQGLQPYVAQDQRVRDAVLEALMNDSDPRIRTASIGLLEPVEADTSVRQVLNSVSNTDDNPHIRYVSRQILDQVPEIQ